MRTLGTLALIGALALGQGIDDAVENRMTRGNAALEEGRNDDAIREFTRAIELKASHAAAWVGRAQAKHRKKDYDGAIADYGGAIEQDPKHNTARWWRSALLQWKQKHAEAIADLDVVIENSPGYANAYLKRAESRRQLLDFGGAGRDLDEVLALQPDNKAAYLLAAKLREDVGDYVGIVEVYARLIKLDPKFAAGYRGRGRAKAYLDDIAGSNEDYEQAIKLAPDDIENLIERAQTRMVKGNEEGALEDCDAVVKMAPKDYRTYYTRGRVLYNFGRFRKARVDLLKAIRRANYEPDYLQLYLFLTQSRLRSFKARAAGQLKEYVAGKKTMADAWFLKVVAYLTGDLPEKDFLAAAQDATPKKTAERRCEAFFYAGTMRLIQDDVETAKRHFQASIETQIRYFIEYESATIELARLR